MKKNWVSVLAMILALCMLFSLTAMAANEKTTYVVVSIEDDEGTTKERPYRIKLTDESSHYLTEAAPLLPEVVAIINIFYDPDDRSTPMWDFESPAMQDIMDAGLEAYGTGSDTAWYHYVDTYFEDVKNLDESLSTKSILRDKTATLGDLIPNVDHKITFKNTVAGDPKYGVTYTVTVTRYVDGQSTAQKPQLDLQDHIAYINGYPDDTVRHNANITREEATAIFYRLLTDESRAQYETADCTFTDVAEARWSRTAIATMCAAGIVTGRTDDTFDPTAPITRAEFAVIAARFDALTYEGEDLFPDIAGHWAADYINQAATRGWVKGDNGLYRPNDPITRAEAVTLINRILERQPETAEDLLEDMIVFTDNKNAEAWYYLAIQEAANGHTYTRKADGIHETWSTLIQ